MTSIGSGAFSSCSWLEEVHIADLAAWCAIEFDDRYANPLYFAHNLYLNDELITNFVIPDSVTNIGEYTFSGCSGLTGITIPDNVTSIGSYAFEGCIGLTNITIPNSVTSIGRSAFYGCSGLESLTIPFVGAQKDGNENTHFGYIFGDASGFVGNVPSSLITVVITGGTNIDDEAFNNCTGLTSITIPDCVTSIGRNAFDGCSGLTSITIPDSVTSIGNSAFYGSILL